MAERAFEPLPITVEVASVFADIVADARLRGRRPGLMDVWIAATAVANGLPVYTQDADFDGLRGVTVVKI
jgi:predicted nucleic acid-binding protein